MCWKRKISPRWKAGSNTPQSHAAGPHRFPGVHLLRRNGMFITQEPNKVTFLYQSDHQVRHVYLNVPHSANVNPSYYGESVGHYEGDTLVVDTIAFRRRSP
jgi:hypothetical protein